MIGWLAALAIAALVTWKAAIAQWTHDKIASLRAGRGGQ